LGRCKCVGPEECSGIYEVCFTTQKDCKNAQKDLEKICNGPEIAELCDRPTCRVRHSKPTCPKDCEPGPPQPVKGDFENGGNLTAENCEANDNLTEIANSFISRCRKASIRREFPGELLNETLGAIKKGKSAQHKKAWKLLNDNRFKK
jgi:hypothetical protein